MADDKLVMLASLDGYGGAADLLESLGAAGVTVVRRDAGDRRPMADMLHAAAQSHGRIDVLLFALPAAPVRTSAERLAFDAFDDAMAGGLKALFLAMKPACARLAAQGEGVFILLTDAAALSAVAGDVLASTTAHAALGLVRAAALDIAASGARVNAICASRRADRTDRAEAAAIADMAAFLGSRAARSITGAHFLVDGGQAAAFNPGVPLTGQEGVHAALR